MGLGKTYTALAVAAARGGRLCIVAPAALRRMWEESLAACGLHAAIVTHEALSRGARVDDVPDFIVVDEAHRLKSPATRRYAALAELCRRCPVLLVTATPVHNSLSDLVAQLALFLGRVAWQMSDDELALYVVRDSGSGARGVPSLNGPHRLALETDDDCLDDLLALPPPVPARNETVVAALLIYGLLHQWSSSRAALIAALTRRRARGVALMSALDAGRHPSRAELSSWVHAGDAVQLAFPELVAAEHVDDDVEEAALRRALERHSAALDALVHRLRATPDPDLERAALLRRVKAAHPGTRVIAFCHYEETVNSLRSRLSRDPGVAALTARGARVAGGRISRDDVVAQFAPRADGSLPIGSAGHIDLLITTDLLSEGLNLQDASVVVHLDLPWNPARLDQRVGRVRRLGSRHDVVHVYLLSPPAPAERLLRIEERLRDKLSTAGRTVGVAGRILPPAIGALAHGSGLAEQGGTVQRKLRAWLATDVPHDSELAPSIAAVEAPVRGFLAVVGAPPDARLVADIGAGIESSVTAVERAIDIASAGSVAPDAPLRSWALEQLDRWLCGQRAVSAIDLRSAGVARSRRAALARVAQALARTPRHRRALIAPLADDAREAATAPLGEGAERILETLIRAELPDDAWLRSIVTFGELNARPAARHLDPGQAPRIRAVILFQP